MNFSKDYGEIKMSLNIITMTLTSMRIIRLIFLCMHGNNMQGNHSHVQEMQNEHKRESKVGPNQRL